jgi:hypothetical protein
MLAGGSKGLLSIGSKILEQSRTIVAAIYAIYALSHVATATAEAATACAYAIPLVVAVVAGRSVGNGAVSALGAAFTRTVPEPSGRGEP